MDNKNASSVFERLSSEKSLLRILIFGAVLSIATVILAALLDFDLNQQFDRVALGAFGDLVRGLLNPILTFFTFAAIIITIRLQKIELREARNEFNCSADALAKENFEATFFRMTSMLKDTVSAIDVTNRVDQSISYTGTDAFSRFVFEVKSNYETIDSPDGKPTNLDYEYASIWPRYSDDLDHYFRILTQIAQYVDTTMSINNGENRRMPFDVIFYGRLFREHLSNSEVTALLIHLVFKNDPNLNNLLQRLGFLDATPE